MDNMYQIVHEVYIHCLSFSVENLHQIVHEIYTRTFLVLFCGESASGDPWGINTVLWLCPSLSTETLKWLSSLPILMQKSFWWWQCSDRHIVSLFPRLHTPPPPHFSPFLISLMVSLDVKYHVYLRMLSDGLYLLSVARKCKSVKPGEDSVVEKRQAHISLIYNRVWNRFLNKNDVSGGIGGSATVIRLTSV